MDVKVIKEREDYSFECNMSEEYKTYESHDEWGCACVWIGEDKGAEYNFCFDGGNSCCAIYKMEMNHETGYMETDYSIFVHYDIEWDKENWKEELEDAMCKALIEFFALDKDTIEGILYKDPDGKYSLWTGFGLPADIQKQIQTLLEPYINEGGSTSPCDSIKELFEEITANPSESSLVTEEDSANPPMQFEKTHLGYLVCELTRELDRVAGLDNAEGIYKHYCLITKCGREERYLPIRIPGGTVGTLWYDENGIITKLHIDTNYVVKTYSNELNEVLEKYVGIKIDLSALELTKGTNENRESLTNAGRRDNSAQIMEDIKDVLFDDRQYYMSAHFNTWVGDGHSFIITDEDDAQEYRVTVTKEGAD